MFYDLNIPYSTQLDITNQQNELYKKVALLTKFGYQVIAHNHTIIGKVNPNKTNPIKKFDIYENSGRDVKLEQLTRLTVVLEDSSQNYGLTSSNNTILSYDIFAVQPINEKSFQNTCSNFDVDIISLEMGSRLPFYLKHGMVGLAIDCGIFFEICYSPTIRDSISRQHLISNAQNLVRVTCGKNIIISSEAQRAIELRGPYDIINLGTIMGMNQALSKDCITTNCRAVVMHAATRRNAHKAVISFKPVSSLKQSDLWRIECEKKKLEKIESKGKRIKIE
ncbi:16703_t:CDS:2 [Entrophospora sp. SA101]|nr:16703_t:CDS:2 [Entrophospora sp. SA101]